MLPPLSYPTSAAGGKRASLIGAACKAALSAAQIVIGLLSGSAAMLADSVHNLGDALYTLGAYVALRFAERPADAEHRYGHGQVETLSALVVAGMMFAAGVGIVVQGVARAAHSEPLVAPALWGASAALLSIVVNLWLARYYRRAGERVRSPALLATAADARQDALSSVVALAGVVAGSLAAAWLDVGAAVVIGIVLAIMAARMGLQNLHILLGGVADDETLEADIAALVKRHDAARDVHNIKVVQMGAWLHVALDLAVDGDLSVYQGHEIAVDILNRIRALNPRVGDVQVHVDPWIEGAVHDASDDRHFHEPSQHDVRFQTERRPAAPADNAPGPDAAPPPQTRPGGGEDDR